MRLSTYRPSPALSRYIDFIWVANGTAPHRRERVLPNGAIELIFNLGSYHRVVSKVDERQSEIYKECWLAGLQSESIIIEALRETSLIGVRFRPGGAYAFLRFPASEVTDLVLESDEIFGSSLRGLREQLLETQTVAQRIGMIEVFLLSRINLAFEDPVVSFVLQEISQDTRPKLIRQLSKEIGLSNKQIISRFHRVVGVSPKLLGRILRFQQVLSYTKGSSEVSWTEVAQRCNYYDQAHMIREFHLLTDSTPSDYLQRRDHNENHMVIA
jgi:AraC-like DNA-binding protein